MTKLKPEILNFDYSAAVDLSYLPCKKTLRQTAKVLRKIKCAAKHGSQFIDYYKFLSENVRSQLINRGFTVSSLSESCSSYTISWKPKEAPLFKRVEERLAKEATNQAEV